MMKWPITIKRVLGLVLVFSLVAVIFSSPALAISQQDLNSIITHTPYYTPGGRESCGTGSSVVLAGSDNAEKVYNYLTGKGFTPFQAAGIMGNMQGESHMEPRIVEYGYLNSRGEVSKPGPTSLDDNVPPNQKPNGQPGYGLVGWTAPSYKQDLRDISANTGVIAGDLGLQLDYLMKVLTTGQKAGLADQLKATTNVEEATSMFLNKFEIPANPVQPIRLSFAQGFLALYGSGTTPSTTPTATPTDTGTTGCNSSAGIGGYTNPLRDVPGVKPARIDMGVDYIGDGPVHAIGNGKVIYAKSDTGWPGGNYLSYTLADGPAAGKTIYVAENCDIQVSVGQSVDSNTVLCNMHSSYPFIEMGWSDENPTDSPKAWGKYKTAEVPDGSATNFGQNFNALMIKLGAPAGTYQFSGQQGQQVGNPLPSGWPTW